MSKSRFLVALLVLTTTVTFSQKPNYSGTWILNLEKSRLTSGNSSKITKTIFVIEQEGDIFSLTRYRYMGEKKRKLKFKMTADGERYNVKLLFNGKLEWIEDHLRASIWNKGFSNIVNYTFGSSEDEFIADETFTSAKTNYHNYWVFDRIN